MSEETEAQRYARNAAARTDEASAQGTDQKLLDIRTVMFLEQIASGDQIVVPSDEYDRLKALDAEG